MQDSQEEDRPVHMETRMLYAAVVLENASWTTGLVVAWQEQETRLTPLILTRPGDAVLLDDFGKVSTVCYGPDPQCVLEEAKLAAEAIRWSWA